MVDRGQHDLGRERQRCHHRPRGDGAVVGPIWHASSQITEELALDAAHFDRVRARAVARRNTPAMAAIADEVERVLDRVLLLHISRATAVLEIVDAMDAYERVLNATKINPEMRELVREQRPGVKIFVSVIVFPPVSRN